MSPIPPKFTRIVPAQQYPRKAIEAVRESGNLLTPAEAAERLGVTERVLERLRSTGEGPDYIKLTTKTLRYRAEDLEAFVVGNVRRNTAQ